MHTVLVVEDDARIRELVELVLTRAGFSVLRANSGPAAIDVLAHNRPDLMLLDVSMPGMSGLDLLHHVAESGPKGVPVMMMTANGDAEVVRQAVAAGAVGYVLKPFTPDLLVARVHRALSQSPASAPAARTAGGKTAYIGS